MENSQLTSKTPFEESKPFRALQKLVEILRGDQGCPWDKKQTPSSISQYLIEEVYELAEAVEKGKPDEICGELGDVLFHIFFIASFYNEKGKFDIGDVAQKNLKKMVRRHPHVFGDKKISDPGKVSEQWNEIKKKENKELTEKSITTSVPVGLPALMRAYKISERAALAGFDWSDISGVMEKAEEEWTEFKTAVSGNDSDQILMEFGDILFTMVNVARFAGIHPETALAESIRKFNRRFRLLEKMVSDQGRKIESFSQDELEIFWEKAKQSETRPDQ